MQRFLGHMPSAGLFAGFMTPNPPSVLMPSVPLISRFQSPELQRSETAQKIAAINRGDLTVDVADLNKLMLQMFEESMAFQRTITSSMTAFPARENLEAEAKILVPTDTPVRNRLRRKLGSGKSSAWKQLTSLGGGFGLQTTVTTGASSATQTVGSTAGMRAGDILWFATSALARTVSSITNATVVVLTATISTTTAETVTNTSFPVGSGANAASQTRAFFAETGAPAAHSSVYADKSATYKLLGTYYDVTGFAMAAGANFQPQYETERGNAIKNLMLNEENALINSDSTVITPPWGDGTTAMGFDGLNALIATGNGVPSVNVQASVGALTTSHIDSQLKRIWENGGSSPWMVLNGQEALSLNHLAEASGSIIRINQVADGVVLGKRVVGFLHPISGEMVDILVSRFQPPGTMHFCSDFGPDGTPAVDIDVLPQVQLPALAPNEDIQGYTAQILAPTTSAPQVYPGIVTVYETVRMKDALVFGKSTGVTAV